MYFSDDEVSINIFGAKRSKIVSQKHTAGSQGHFRHFLELCYIYSKENEARVLGFIIAAATGPGMIERQIFLRMQLKSDKGRKAHFHSGVRHVENKHKKLRGAKVARFSVLKTTIDNP